MVDPTQTAVMSLASHGLLGMMLIIVGWVAWRKDVDLQAERLARIEDAKDYTRLALDLQAKVLDSVNKLADILDEMKKLMATPGRSSSFGGNR